MKYKFLRMSLLSFVAMLFGTLTWAAISNRAEDATTIYSWEKGGDNYTETGGKAAASGADDSANDLTKNYIRLKGKNDYSTNIITITLDKELNSGDQIHVTAYRDKNATGKTSGFKAKFEKGGEIASSTGQEFVNINEAVKESEEYGTEPNTCTFDVPEAAAGSKIITITRSHTSTNLYITKLEITSKAGDEGGSGEGGGETTFPITAKWDWQNETPASISSVNIQKTTGTVASDVDGIELMVDATCENGKLAAGSNSNGKYAQFNKGTIIKVPVVSNKDKLTVISYPGQYKYTIGGTAASADETNYSVTDADVKQGYVEIIATGGAYIYSITIVQDKSAAPSGDDETATDVTATWDFVKNCANLAPKAEGGAYTATTMASDVESIEMTIVYNGGQIKNNDNSYYVGTGVEMQIPVKNVGDEVTVVGYPGYFHYSIAGVEAENQTTTYKAKATDVSQGYVAVVATASNNYINSISVTQYAPKAENIVEKSIYKTDFSDWTKADPSDPATTVTKTT